MCDDQTTESLFLLDKFNQKRAARLSDDDSKQYYNELFIVISK